MSNSSLTLTKDGLKKVRDFVDSTWGDFIDILVCLMADRYGSSTWTIQDICNLSEFSGDDVVRILDKGNAQRIFNRLRDGNIINLVNADCGTVSKQKYIISNEVFEFLRLLLQESSFADPESLLGVLDKIDKYLHCLDVESDTGFKKNPYPEFIETQVNILSKLCYRLMSDIKNHVEACEKQSNIYKSRKRSMESNSMSMEIGYGVKLKSLVEEMELFNQQYLDPMRKLLPAFISKKEHYECILGGIKEMEETSVQAIDPRIINSYTYASSLIMRLDSCISTCAIQVEKIFQLFSRLVVKVHMEHTIVVSRQALALKYSPKEVISVYSANKLLYEPEEFFGDYVAAFLERAREGRKEKSRSIILPPLVKSEDVLATWKRDIIRMLDSIIGNMVKNTICGKNIVPGLFLYLRQLVESRNDIPNEWKSRVTSDVLSSAFQKLIEWKPDEKLESVSMENTERPEWAGFLDWSRYDIPLEELIFEDARKRLLMYVTFEILKKDVKYNGKSLEDCA